MSTSVPTKKQRALPALVIGLLVGIAAGAGVLYAHFSGKLTLLYHSLGLHALAANEASEHAGHGGGGASMTGHAGHGGMSMSSMQEPAEPSKIPGYSIVTISPERQQRIGVRTGKVEHGKLLMDIRAVGIIEPDQARLSRVQPRISGWVTKVHVNFVGQEVKKGDPLLEIYSPELVSTQEEYLIALEAGQKSLANAARRRLELWDVPADEIKELEKSKKARETLLLRARISGRVLERNALEGTRVEPAMELYRIADLSVVWLQAKIYEYELPHVEIGQPVHITLVSQPDKELEGKVGFIEPVFQETTRTVKVRVVLNNPKNELRPGMYADLKIDHDMGHGLLVPESALMRTGERTLVFRVLPENRFEPVEVRIGGRFGERFEVLTGLSEGDTVVTSAGFLIDSESRLKSATAAMGGHQHGAAYTKAEEPKKEKAAPKAGHEHDHHHH
jgi:Cu(I)/Ag(I) efflux system membrane fusion protein